MTWRDPRPANERVDATRENLVELAANYSPMLRYAADERFFPVLAESWLSHTSAAPWDAADAEEDDLPADLFRRGTAVCRSNAVDVTLPDGTMGSRLDVTKLGGAPNAGERPIQLGDDRRDPDAIGAYDTVDADTFLDLAGWRPGADRKRGDDEYLAAVFSELSSAMNPSLPWDLVEGLPNQPHLWVPQPVNPTTYCEVEWGGMYPRWSAAAGNTDFPADGVPALDDVLVLTYYYLYPARVPAAGETGPRTLEGQWEAISLFFPAQPGTARDADGRPTELTFSEPPTAVVGSRGLERSMTGAPHVNRQWTWGELERLHCHPVLYVSSGTHRHFSVPVAGTPWDPTTNPPGSTGINYGGGGEFPGMEMLLVYAAALATLGVFVAATGPVGWVIGAILVALALLLVLLWLISLIWEAVNQASGDPVPAWSDNDQAPGDGAQAGTAEEEPAGGPTGTGPGPGPAEPPGTPNAGSPSGRNTVSFDVRLVDLLHEADTRTGFPANRPWEHPYWWDYTGSWGVNVTPAVDNDWESGTQRVDTDHRSWGYWNALRVATVLAGGSTGDAGA